MTIKEKLRKLLQERLIDNQNMNSGTQVLCNKMSVATYEEGLSLIKSAIGEPNTNPILWDKISKPLQNWKQENIEINTEKQTIGMSGDSMIDESNTYWTVIQSTICEQGNNNS